jgi:hypothetical protein
VIRRAALTAAAIGVIMVTTPAQPAAAASPTLVLDQIALYDSTVMQGVTGLPDGSWIFTQLTQDGRAGKTGRQHATAGDITLTRVGPAGRIWGHMFLLNSGHGIRVDTQPGPGGVPWVWTETHAVPDPPGTGIGDGYGTRIMRFPWRPGAVISETSPGVEVFGVNAGAPHQSVSLDLAHGLIGDRYVSPTTGQPRIAVYRLADFLNHTYPAVRRITVPAEVAALTSQGWCLIPGDGTTVEYRTGDVYSASNPPPGNSTLWRFTEAGVTSRVSAPPKAGLTLGEPEGVSAKAGRLYFGFASGPAGARRASLYSLPI